MTQILTIPTIFPTLTASDPFAPGPSSRLARSPSPDLLACYSESVLPSRGPTAPDAQVGVVVEGLGEVKLAVDAAPGCGGITWASGEVMARYLSYRHSLDRSYLQGKKILELGSGTGLVGLVAALLEPSADVWITDQEPLLDLMEQNISLNYPSTPPAARNIHVTELDWGTDLNAEVPRGSELILAADCVYFEPAFPLLVETLCQLAPVGEEREILFTWKKRRKADLRFFKLLHKHFTSLPVEDDRPGAREVYEREGVRMLRLVRTK